MPKYLLLKHYRGGPEPYRPVPPMDQWAPEDVEAHMAFLKHVSELLEKNGEYVDAQALTPARTWVRYSGPDAAPVTTDGPLPETSDLVAGWYMIDRESVGSASGAASPMLIWRGRMVRSLGPGLTFESADAARAVLRNDLSAGSQFFWHPPALPV